MPYEEKHRYYLAQQYVSSYHWEGHWTAYNHYQKQKIQGNQYSTQHFR